MTTANGRPVDVSSNGDSTARPRGRFSEIGHEGLYISAGYVLDEFLANLKGDKAIRTWREMGDNDPIVGGMLHGIKMLARQVDWTIEPDEDDDSDEYTDFVDSCFHDMSASWEDTLSQIMSMVQYGWHFAEIVYKKRDGFKPETSNPNSPPSSKYDDGKIGWRKLPGRSQDTRFRWEVDIKTGAILGMHQRIPNIPQSFYIPMQKALLFRTQADKGNPEGRSALRSAYRPWFFKSRIEQIEATGVERDLAGFPIMWVPHTMMMSTATDEEKMTLEVFKDIARNIKRDEQEGLVMPLAYDEDGNKLYDVSLLSATGRRQFDTDAIIGRYNQHIALAVLADFMLLGNEKVGSHALGASKIELFTAGLEAWLDGICDVFNTHAIPRLLRVNGMDPMRAPKLVHAKIQSVDAAVLGTAIAQLAQAGMPLFPDDALEMHIREAIGLPPKSPDAHPQAMLPKPGEGPGQPEAAGGGLTGSPGGVDTPADTNSPTARAAQRDVSGGPPEPNPGLPPRRKPKPQPAARR